jgi:hypothetical protein
MTRRSVLGPAIVLIVAACNAGPQPTPTPLALVLPSAAPVASVVPAGSAAATASQAPSLSATPDQQTIRKAAAAAYLAAAKRYNTATKALERKYPTFKNLTAARTYYRVSGRLEAAFIKAMKAITFPTDTASDAHALIRAETAIQALEAEGASVHSWSDVASVEAAMTKAGRNSSAAANLVRSDLNLPPIKY